MDYALLLDRYACGRDVGAWPRQRLLHECLRDAIRGGIMAPGTRLLATRALAAELGIARNSVLYAYEQLATEGYVRPDRRGTVVGVPGARCAPRQLALAPAKMSRRAAALGALAPPVAAAVGFAPGVPALDEFPVHVWRRLLDRAWRETRGGALNYGDPAGHPALRAAIADHLRAARGAQCDMAQVFITNGTQASLDLCAHAFADAGDKA